MKLVFALTLMSVVMAFGNDFKGDPNMSIGLNPGKVTEASFGDISKAHQNSQSSFGQQDTANCPLCNEPTPLTQNVERKDNVLLDGAGSVIPDSSGNAVQTGTSTSEPGNTHQ